MVSTELKAESLKLLVMIVVSDSNYLQSTLFPIHTPGVRSYEERMHVRNKEENENKWDEMGLVEFCLLSTDFSWNEKKTFFGGKNVVRFFGKKVGGRGARGR